MRASMLTTCVITLTLGFSRAGLADYRVVNHSNEVVNVAITFHMSNGHVFTKGWDFIRPNEEKTVYFGNEARICVAILSGPNRTQITPGNSYGAFDRYAHVFSAFANEDDDFPGTARLQWEGRVYFQKGNAPLPPGWYIQRFFIVNGNERFEVHV